MFWGYFGYGWNLGIILVAGSKLSKEFPKGPSLGHWYNIFINDIFLFIENITLYNYADDNTASYANENLSTMKSILENESKIC